MQEVSFHRGCVSLVVKMKKRRKHQPSFWRPLFIRVSAMQIAVTFLPVNDNGELNVHCMVTKQM